MQGNVYSQYMSRIYGGIAIHSIPYKLPASDTLFATKFNSLGTPRFRGCIVCAPSTPSGSTTTVPRHDGRGLPKSLLARRTRPFCGRENPHQHHMDPSDPLPGNPYSHINTDPIPYARQTTLSSPPSVSPTIKPAIHIL
jgi:hypothetical protein